MDRATFIKISDLISFVILCLLISTGALLKFTLPAGSGSYSLLGLTRHEWGDVHFYISAIFLLLMTVHFFMHIKFLKYAVLGQASRESTYRLAMGLLAILVLVAFLAAPFFAPTYDEGPAGDGRYHQKK